MKYSPHAYQSFAADFILKHDEAAIFLDLGMGKSVITLTALWQLMLDEFKTHRALVIAPLRVANSTWAQELQKWDHLEGLTMAVATGTKQDRIDALTRGAMITVINRENVPWLVDYYGETWPFDTVIIDELSSFKSHTAKRFKALVKTRPHIRRMVGLTGTPASNGLMDLWAQFKLLDGGNRLGYYISHYRNRYFTPDKRNGQQIFSYKLLPGAEEQIYEAIADMTVSMKTSDHLKLPELTTTNVTVELDTKERKLYEQLRDEMVVELGDEVIDAASAATLSGKLLQLASGAIYNAEGEALMVHGRKLDALEDLIESANGQPLLVAYWFQHDLERISQRFPVARQLKTDADIQAWNCGEIPLALIHPASAGHGLNLQAGGSLMVWFSLTWSLELYQQTNARLYRQGQEKPVTITHLVTAGSIDENVLAALEAKDMTQAALIEAVKTQLTERTPN